MACKVKKKRQRYIFVNNGGLNDMFNPHSNRVISINHASAIPSCFHQRLKSDGIVMRGEIDNDIFLQLINF